jgi:hypothetical protein
MCGKDAAISGFDPQKLDRDIYIRQVVRLEAGKGFTYEPDISVLGDDEFTPMIKDRCIDLIRLFIEQDILTEEELMKELKIGVPVEGNDQVIPYEDVLKMVSQLKPAQETQATDELLRRLLVSKPNMYKEKYDELVKELELKKKIDDILRDLNKTSDSEIILTEDDWILRINKDDPITQLYLWRKLYELSPEEREMLRKRISTDSPVLHQFFEIMKSKPQIRDMNDLMNYGKRLFFPG